MASEDEVDDNDVTLKGTETSTSQLADLEIQKIVHSAATDMATAQSKVVFFPHVSSEERATNRSFSGSVSSKRENRLLITTLITSLQSRIMRIKIKIQTSAFTEHIRMIYSFKKILSEKSVCTMYIQFFYR